MPISQNLKRYFSSGSWRFNVAWKRQRFPSCSTRVKTKLLTRVRDIITQVLKWFITSFTLELKCLIKISAPLINPFRLIGKLEYKKFKMKSNIVSEKRLPVPLQGLDLYPAPFTSPIVGTGGTCIPQDEVARHWPCVVKIINDYARELDLPDKIVYIFDQRVSNLILDFIL